MAYIYGGKPLMSASLVYNFVSYKFIMSPQQDIYTKFVCSISTCVYTRFGSNGLIVNIVIYL